MKFGKVNCKPVADKYSSDNEKIIEFSHSNGGDGLISIRFLPTGETIVDIYRLDNNVRVNVGYDSGYRYHTPESIIIEK